MIVIFFIPALIILASICFSFDSELTLHQKLTYFLILPIIEIVVSIIAVIQARAIEINLLENWQLYLLYFAVNLGITTTLIVVLIEELNNTIKLVIRLTTLAIFGFIISWGFLSL